MRTCTQCSTSKPLEEFSKNGYHKGVLIRRPVCKKCYAPKQADAARRWKDRGGREFHRHYMRYFRYGLSKDSYLKMVEDSKGLCAICNNPEPEGTDLSVDHCHTTGKIRGLLCRKCNRGLGHFNDNQEVLIKAYEYLKRSKD